MWMSITFTAVDEDAEKVLSCDLEDSGEDIRRCILCWHYGDSDPNVRFFLKKIKHIYIHVHVMCYLNWINFYTCKI